MLVQLTYASRVSKTLGSEDIKNILQHSQTNNQADGVTGALCLSNGIFLQILEGDRNTVNRVYHKILQDSRHKDPAILDYQEITARQFSDWSMGLIAKTEDNKQLFLKYSSNADFDPYSMSAESLRGFFDEVVGNVRWLRKSPA
ncbi:BLUF domain-containing protein [Kangiella aquimarina]|uniref:BLUF domain-containing protein n=1 Tax=Kangiella aquimarina TaxID=261965 RepID=A0ABZ0X671_9GAMM|nr:BLUF domain-containing protein [Kangiella aquimarina]WQG86101.1 BLUF domain-containing protein [Kangiella aquimarina]